MILIVIHILIALYARRRNLSRAAAVVRSADSPHFERYLILTLPYEGLKDSLNAEAQNLN